ncbi:ImmA/IrrE family metallo-endopeptidase [Marisediminicola sp. LYQ134]|uniref:ImmA/IrrE family metallo-endopeptidase n=1 Tax=Marisediminicola sp. LYQ134 TaxID=3391061 RepID=UPI0039831D0D
MNDARQIRLDATREAARLRRDLGVAADEPADPFHAINELGLWLLFNELDGLLGAMSREGVGGILINPLRPLGMQRYTAAHELGHWRMHPDHETTWDSDEEVMKSGIRIEREAQAFAAAFLMPRRLLNAALRREGISPGDLVSPHQAYAISRDIGVSYEALVHELANIKKITPQNRTTLLKKRVRDIKAALGGSGETISGSQLWTVERQNTNNLVHLLEGDELSVTLPEAPSTGYRWDFDDVSGSLDVVRDVVEPNAERLIGGALTRQVLFRAEQSGEVDVVAHLTRPFERGNAAVDSFAVRAEITPTPARQSAMLVTATGVMS